MPAVLAEIQADSMFIIRQNGTNRTNFGGFHHMCWRL